MPTSPNSLTITATRRPCSAVRMRLSNVVLPEPRKPVRIMTEALVSVLVAPGVVIPGKVGCFPAGCKPQSALGCLSLITPLVDDRRLHLADDPAGRIAVLHLHVASYDGVHRHALHLPAAPRCRMVLAVKLVGVDGRFLVHIYDGEIAIGPEPDGPFLWIHLPDLGDVLALHFGIMVERHAALVHLRQQQRNVGFDAAEAGDAIPDRGLEHLAVDVTALFLERVRRMVGRNHVDRAFKKAL